MTQFITVVVCTYNRGDLITGCLDSLADQTAEPSSFEVLVIDNNSSDNTYSIVSQYCRLQDLRLISEPAQGLSHARNRGLQEAKGDYIAYLDDDARVDPQYIENILKLLDQFSDSVDCYGGPILPFYTSPKPDWFKDEYEIRRLRKEAGFQTRGQSFSGSNMIWKKSTLQALGGFNPDVGIRGNQLILGEETLLFDKLWKTQSPRLFYSPDLVVFHWVPDYKMQVKYRMQRAKATGAFMGFELKLSKSNKLKEILSSLFMLFKFGLKALFQFPKYRNCQCWVTETLSPAQIEIGKLLTLLSKDTSS